MASLIASPFKFKNLKNPWVLVPVAIAGASTYFFTDNDAPLSAARRVNAIDRDLSPNGSALYEGGIEIYRQMLVGAGEEMYFRGIIQTEMTEQLGPNVGLFLSSFLFGLWHVPNNGVGKGLSATVGGLYMGYRHMATGYDLGEPIAIHFWLNWVSRMVEYVRDPGGGRLVYSISWKI